MDIPLLLAGVGAAAFFAGFAVSAVIVARNANDRLLTQSRDLDEHAAQLDLVRTQRDVANKAWTEEANMRIELKRETHRHLADLATCRVDRDLKRKEIERLTGELTQAQGAASAFHDKCHIRIGKSFKRCAEVFKPGEFPGHDEPLLGEAE